MHLPDTGEVLHPKFAVRKDPAGKGPNGASATPSNGNGAETSAWQLLVDTCEPATDFDRVARTKGGTDASPHGRMERLLRGFQAAHDTSKGKLLATPLKENPDDIYCALLTLVLRLVFLLYAEERDLLPQDETYWAFPPLNAAGVTGWKAPVNRRPGGNHNSASQGLSV